MAQKGENLLQAIRCGRALLFSGQDQVDAAAKVDGDEMRRGCGGGAPVADGGERKKKKCGRVKGKDPLSLFIRRKDK